MAQFLLELFSEEIPARMQAGAARDLDRLARDHLVKADLAFETLTTHAGSRRLTLVVDGLPLTQDDRVEERKGPRLGAPDAALAGFLRSAGVDREALTERDGAYFVTVTRPGQPTSTLLAEMSDSIIRAFPWPKSMLSGRGALRWVRPLRRILCVFDRAIVPLTIEGMESGDQSEGHRFMGEGGPFRARDFDEYQEALAGHFVILEVSRRKALILEGARALCAARGVDLVEDEGLLEEVAGMVEWPAPLLGEMDSAFLDLPAEVVRTSMRTHQRYFAVRMPGATALAPYFVAVANIDAADGGKLIVAGNARVLAARLDDARFFWDEDRKQTLESRLVRLEGVTFHAKLGTMRRRAQRIEDLARLIAPMVGAEPDVAALAGRLCKADLGTAMVGEFPELQGIMGGYYARAEGLDEAVAAAIRDHYRPQGPGDAVPTAPVSIAVALADKLDTLIGFFAVGETPTGSRDPFALRRAALGVIRIILENGLRMNLGDLIAQEAVASGREPTGLWPFILDRLRVQLRDQGERHDLVDAVMALGDGDLVRLVARLAALTEFIGGRDGADLLAGYRRGANILQAEAKKGLAPSGEPSRMTSAPREERALLDALDVAGPSVSAALAAEDFAAALGALAALRVPVDGFFEKVLVNSLDPEERDNRLRLLSRMKAAMGEVADFSLISG